MPNFLHVKKGKEAAHTRLPSIGIRSWSRFLAVSLHVMWVKGCYQFCCLVNRGTMGVNSLPKTVTRQRRGCDLNPGRSAPESSTLTARLPSYPFLHVYDTYTIFRMTLTMWTIVTACCRCFKSNACRCPPKLPLSVAEIRPYPIQCGPTCRGGAVVLNLGDKTWFASEASEKKFVPLHLEKWASTIFYTWGVRARK